MDSITRVRRAASRRVSAEKAWKEAIRQAVADGQSIRVVGKAAGISHVHVLRICRGQTH